MVKKPFKLEDLLAYEISTELSDYVWQVVSEWDWFNKRTLGTQYLESIDSIAGNIAEGFGRYHKKDKIKFYYNARASVFEAAHWTKRAKARNLLTEEQSEHILGELRKLPKEINIVIKRTSKLLEK